MTDDRTLPLHYKFFTRDDQDDLENEAIRNSPKVRADTIPTALFRVNKLISTEALAVLQNEVFFRLEIYMGGMEGRGCRMGYLLAFDNDERIARWPPLKCMRNYHLNIDRVYACYEHDHSGVMECFRLICDELSSRNIVRNLTITAPCLCAYLDDVHPWFQPAVPYCSDYLAPLKRIRVPNLVKFSLHRTTRYTGLPNHPCSSPACLERAREVQASISRLDGETLSDQEASWKEVKAIFRYDQQELLDGYFDTPRRFQWSDRNMDDFWQSLCTKDFAIFDEHVRILHAQRAKREIHQLPSTSVSFVGETDDARNDFIIED